MQRSAILIEKNLQYNHRSSGTFSRSCYHLELFLQSSQSDRKVQSTFCDREGLKVPFGGFNRQVGRSSNIQSARYTEESQNRNYLIATP